MARAPRVYSSRKYSRNPLFRSRKRREFFARLRNVSWRGKLIVALLVAVFVAAIWGVLYNSYFSIENVVIKGAGYVNEGNLYRIAEDQLERRRWLVFPQDNIFTFSKGQLAAAIQNEVSVRNLRIDKDLPGSVTVTFEEAEPVAVWFEEDRYYYIDNELRVLSPVSEALAQSAPYVTLRAGEGETHIAWRGGARVLTIDPAYVTAAQMLRERYGARPLAETDAEANREVVDPAIDSTFTVTTQETTITMHYQNGPQVHFTIDGDVGAQMAKLDVLLAEKFNPDELAKTAYIDLRFGEKIYYQ